jgi:hypothetical protein
MHSAQVTPNATTRGVTARSKARPAGLTWRPLKKIQAAAADQCAVSRWVPRGLRQDPRVAKDVTRLSRPQIRELRILAQRCLAGEAAFFEYSSRRPMLWMT